MCAIQPKSSVKRDNTIYSEETICNVNAIPSTNLLKWLNYLIQIIVAFYKIKKAEHFVQSYQSKDTEKFTCGIIKN